MRYIKICLGLLICFISLSFAFFDSPDTLKIAAAANLASVAPALQSDFNSIYPEANVTFIFNASGILTTQIVKGAPFDLFLSADISYPEKLKAKGLVSAGPARYASGQVVLLTTRKDLDLRKGLQVLTDPSIKLIAIANPTLAPYGAAAIAKLKAAGLWSAIESRVVYAGNITQAFQYTTTATDVGFVAKSALYGPEGLKYNKEGVFWIDIQTSVAQGMVSLDMTKHKKYVKEFYEYMLSTRAQKIMERYGYAQ